MTHSISNSKRRRRWSARGLRLIAIIAFVAGIAATVEETRAQNLTAVGMMATGGWGHHQPGDSQVGYWDAPVSQYEMIPANTGWKNRTPLDKVLSQAFASTWIRLDYLNWDIRDPGDKFLGAPVGQYSNLEDPFPAVDARSGAATPAAVVASLIDINLRNQDGIRGTVGVELMDGTMEANIWYLSQSTIGISQADAISRGFIPATSILNNGVPQQAVTPNAILYNISFDAELETNTMGAEINYIMASQTPNQLFQIRPTVGIRYVQYNEKLTQVGVSDITILSRTSVIESNANNDLFGPQAGLRFELISDRIRLGVHPGFVFGFNRHSARVKTNRLFTPNDPTVVSGERHSEVAPMFSLNVYGELSVTERLKLFVGYDLLWMNKVSRPYENIYYNDNGIGTTPGVLVNVQLNDLLIQGLSVGGAFTF